ncbi:mevalonate kinase-like [Anoplolepis gracilipes]|uniref:mevalonate kinase-like n=1 Tax=Anoplolepis gracilipes TaxID=354296 RepID=UPI003BA10234
MNAFTISAPGKITLCGEHAEMYGKKVVAASLNLRTTLTFYEICTDNIEIEFPRVDISLNVPLKKIQDFTSSEDYNHLVKDHVMFLKHVQYFITINGWWRTYSQNFTLQVFFYLLMYIAHHEKFVIRPFRVHVTTQLKMHTSLGSSTSFAVCLAACFVRWARLQRGDHTEFTQLELKNISKFATFSEKVIQNFKLNCDPDVCVHGHAVSFRQREHLGSDIKILDAQEMDVLLVNSHIFQNKFDQIRNMAATKRSRSNDVGNILNIIDKISQNVALALLEIKEGHKHNNLLLLEILYGELKKNIELNQEMLCKLNLSHTNFNYICSIAKKHGFAGKMTGIGTAYVFILLPPNIPYQIISNLKEDLSNEGFEYIMTKIFCSGLRIEQI